MCGIAGILTEGVLRYRDNLEKMISSLRHRGPDGEGNHFFGNCALGHTRLSIIDLSTGQQPMLSSISDTAITFNGEIYGYRQIKETLAGYPFQTQSDTEVILALYHKYGQDFLNYLPGMFAFAIWDDAKQELICARDRFGEKPFYYAFGANGELVFASEIKSILASGLVRPVLDMDSLAFYMKHLYVHPEKSIYKNIYTLPPGHILNYKNSQTTVNKYWELPVTNNDITLDEAEEKFKYLLEQAVAKQLVADVPVGAFLSGGLDSSTIVALASKYKSKLKTFSFGFGETINELPFARQVSDLYQTEHIELSDNQSDLAEILIGMQEVYDEPFADSSNIPTYLISRLARQHSKVILTGDGGDELLAGYSFWYRSLFNMEQTSRKELCLLQALKMAKKYSERDYLVLGHKIQGLEYHNRFNSLAEAHKNQNQFFKDHELAELGLVSPEESIYKLEMYNSNTVDDALRMDLENYMPGDILVKIDQASMANGLELRAPFLDVDFTSFCISLPSSLKISSEKDKLILRKAYSESWPESVRTRGKQGFGAPVKNWLKQDSFKELKQHYLSNPGAKIFSLLPFDKIQEISTRDNYQTWILLVLSIWLDKREIDLV